MIDVDKNHQIDILEGIKQIDDNTAKLVFADPPYNLQNLDAFISTQNYTKWVKDWLIESRRILTFDGTIIMCGRPPILNYICIEMEELGFVFRDWITWHKVDSITPSKKDYSNNYECFVIYSKWVDRIFHHIPIKSKTENYSKERNIGSVWLHPKISSNHKEGTIHPTQKPIKFLDRFIKTFTNENNLVVDLFVGSGTTSLASMQNNRRFIGFEINPLYIQIANERLLSKPLGV